MDLQPQVETFGQDDQTWLGSAHGTDAARSITIDISTLTAETHYPDGYLPSGTPVGLITATGLYGLYGAAAPGGRDVLAGFTLTALRIRGGNVHGALLEHGRVIVDNLPFPSIVGVPAQTNVAGRIIFADRPPLDGE